MNFSILLFLSLSIFLSFGVSAVNVTALLGETTFVVVPSPESGISGSGYKGANVTFHSNGAGRFMGLSSHNIFENFTFIWEPTSENSTSIRIFGTVGCTAQHGIYELVLNETSDDYCNEFVLAGESDPCTPRWDPLNNGAFTRVPPITCPEQPSTSTTGSSSGSSGAFSLTLSMSVFLSCLISLAL